MRSYLCSLGLLLLAATTHAQQPVLPGAPQPTAAPENAVPPPSAPADYVLGHTYRVALRSGSEFTGRLTALSLDKLDFDTQDLGHVSVLRTEVLRMDDLTSPGAVAGPARVGLRANRYDIGNGTRYFFGPSGRNLRQGEGVVQDVWLFLGGVNYGITDNISIGGYTSLLPGVSIQNQLLVLTPKIGFKVGDGWNLGAGALYIHLPSSGSSSNNVGLLYGVATHGTADRNVSVGLGYGFGNNGIGSTPTVSLAGQQRVSRRISLVSENYIVAAHSPVFFGLYGVKVSWPRVSLGFASGYIGYVDNEHSSNGYYGSSDDSFFFFGYVAPLYIDFSYRFGKVN